MTFQNPSALIVDDNADLRELVRQDLEDIGINILEAQSADAALAVLRERDVDLVLTDVRMPGESGTWLCGELARTHPHIPVIVMTGYGNLDVAIEAMRHGAYDFLSKPFKAAQLEGAIRRALEATQMRREVRQLRRQLKNRRGFGPLLGQSAAMQRVFDLIDRVSLSSASVLLQGESGVGKELVAKAIHRNSRSGDGPFVAFNCAAIPGDLVESELFGHDKGAFSGALKQRRGLFREADGGTLFLDEIGELPPAAQPKLLRALQERTVRPVGSDTEHAFNARILAATHQDLADAINTNDFRADLYYRLAVVIIHVPPLRERRDDILLLAEHFLETILEREDAPSLSISDDAAKHLLAYDWPGNVRELQNSIEHAFMMAYGSNTIEVSHLPDPLQDASPSSSFDLPFLDTSNPDKLASLEDIERHHIERVIDAVDGNKSQAARILGIDRKTLRAKLKRWEEA